MAWDDTKSTVVAACGTVLTPHGYKLVKSRHAFEKSSPSERRGVYLLLIASHGDYSVRPWCGVRNGCIEERFHRTSEVDEKYRATYTTINLDCGEKWELNTERQIDRAVTKARRFITDTALPFLEKDYSLQDYCNLLNTNPTGKCPYHANPENRCHYGLIAAKLADDPRNEELKATYGEYLRSTNKGFYYPRFEKLVADLES